MVVVAERMCVEGVLYGDPPPSLASPSLQGNLSCLSCFLGVLYIAVGACPAAVMLPEPASMAPPPPPALPAGMQEIL